MTTHNPKELLLQAKGLQAWYGAAQILYDVDLDVRRGEVVALMGRNGAGKSTTLKTLMGMLAKRKGSIQFMGRDISKTDPHEAARLAVMLPAPKRFEKTPNSAYLSGRTRTILARMGAAELP